MPALSISTYSFESPVDIQKIISIGDQNGCTGFELGSDAYWPEALSDSDSPYIQDAVAQNNWSLNLDYTFRGATLEDRTPETCQRAILQLEDCLQLAGSLGAQTVTIRMGLIAQTLPPDAETVRVEAYQLLVDALKYCVPLVEANDVYLLVENAQLRPTEVLTSYAQYVQLLDDVGSPRLKFIMDPAHAHTFTGIADVVQELGPRSHSVHMHDNHGVRGEDEHLDIGSGNIDFQPWAEFLRQVPGMVTYKGKTVEDEEGSVIRSLKVLQALLGN